MLLPRSFAANDRCNRCEKRRALIRDRDQTPYSLADLLVLLAGVSQRRYGGSSKRAAKSVSHSSHNLFIPIFRHDLRSLVSPRRPRENACLGASAIVTVTTQSGRQLRTYENKFVDGPRRLAPRNLEARVQTTRKILIVRQSLSTLHFSHARTYVRKYVLFFMNYKTQFKKKYL